MKDYDKSDMFVPTHNAFEEKESMKLDTFTKVLLGLFVLGFIIGLVILKTNYNY